MSLKSVLTPAGVFALAALGLWFSQAPTRTASEKIWPVDSFLHPANPPVRGPAHAPADEGRRQAAEAPRHRVA